ncbi:MAG TPA: helix-turn-helix domain-containing protein, partial [Geminicoccaceae bacterium]|nr:helix-turn-helix domain-containing protein [Geminicoccaceae bacterium]
SGEFMPVGGRQPVRANLRIVAATHRELRQLVGQGLFREDLFYRLNVVPIRLPALRQRREDVPALVQHFLARAHAEGLPLKTISLEGMDLIRQHDWPGNVRELENLIRRLAVLYTQETIGPDVIEAELREGQAGAVGGGRNGAEAGDFAATVERYIQRHFPASPDGRLPAAGLYGRVMREIERPLIGRALAATRGNQLKAAHLLGLNRNTLRKKIRELEIEVVRGPR